MALPSDQNWPPASNLLASVPSKVKENVAIFGLHTYETSVSTRSSVGTPDAIREALARYSTWSYSNQVDLLELFTLVDYGNVQDPDGSGGFERVRSLVESISPECVLTVILGGDNAATWHGLRSIAKNEIETFGLITLDAHHDLRDGTSNGSPVRQLLDSGLQAKNVVQVGIADFSNSAFYAKRARDAGISTISRDELRSVSIEEAAKRALNIAGANGQSIYVDIDVDVADRSVVPGCPAAAPGGLSADELRRFTRTVCADSRVKAIDITEIDVEKDSIDQRTVRLAALIVLEVLSGIEKRKNDS